MYFVVHIMTKVNFKQKIPSYFIQVVIVSVLVIVNISISLLVRSLMPSYTLNTRPFGIQAGNDISIAVILILITYGLYAFNYIKEYTTFSILVLAGAWSNFVERALFGEVADYLNLIIAVINIADIQIWAGLILLNYYIWLKKPQKYS